MTIRARPTVIVLAGIALCGAGVPPQIVPTIREPGAPNFSFPGNGTEGEASSGSSGSSTSGTWVGDGTATDALSTLQSQSYGAAAISAAQNDGINPATLAAFGQVESHFANVGNGTSSAQGVWQITQGTWDDTVSRYNLPYTEADRDDPTAQADVASHIISEYATAVSSSTGQPATSLQTYGAYMFGPTAGAAIASTSNTDAPLSQFVSSTALKNNGMTGWTVGQYYQTMAQRMGTGASATVYNA